MLWFSAYKPKGDINKLTVLDRLMLIISIGMVPLSITMFSVVAFATFDHAYFRHQPHLLGLHVINDRSQHLQIEDALKQLSVAPLQSYYDTELLESPFWFLFSVPAMIGDDLTQVEMPSRHAQKITCWDGTGQQLLGSATRDRVRGQMSMVKTGFALSLGAMTTPQLVLCKGVYSGPARISVQQLSNTDLVLAESEFRRHIGWLEGGLLMLIFFVSVAAIINREWIYVLFAIWLLGNLRMGAMSMGSDMQWLTWMIPNDYMSMLRKLTCALYCVVTVTMFGALFKNELRQIGFAFLLRLVQFFSIALIGAALVLPFAQFLPILWCLSALCMMSIVFLLVRILLITYSRVALWYSVSLAIILFATLDEVVAAAFGIKALSGILNSVTAALLSSLMATLAFAEQMRAERKGFEQAQSELRSTYEVTPIGLFTLDAIGNFVHTNAALEKILGLDPITQRLKNWGDYFESGAWQRLQQIALKKNGNEAELRGIASDEQEARFYLITAIFANNRIEGSLQDITERSKALLKLQFLAENDSLTGVLNRHGIEKILRQAIQDQSDTRPLALAYLDLDRFKLINDLFGHQAGDEVLKQLCSRIRRLLIDDSQIGRIGGDEFLIVFRDTKIHHARDVCSTIIQEISSQPYNIGARAFQVKGSMGLIEVNTQMRTQDAIFAVDRACREAKRAHSEHLVVYPEYAPAFQERLEELSLIEKLGGEFLPPGLFIEMQPIMSLQAPDESLNFEVLLRLHDADNNVVSATKVISAAEENGNIGAIDRWVVSTVLEWLAQHQLRLQRTKFVCVNLSGASLNDEKFIQDIFQIMEKYRQVVSLLCIEITESVALHDLEHTRQFIYRLQDMGAKVALDDFGAGYTSFTYLKELSADALKIDGAFIRSMNQHPANEAIVEAIVELARNLGMKSIAEWVEDCSVIEVLATLGVDYVQGFVVATPQSPNAILSAHSAASFITDEAMVRFVRDRRASETKLT